MVPGLNAKAQLKSLVPDIESCLFFLAEVGHAKDERKPRLMRYISDIGENLSEDLETIGLDGPTAYSIRCAIPYHDLPYGHVDPKVEELHRLIRTLAPLARKGKVEEARRIY